MTHSPSNFSRRQVTLAIAASALGSLGVQAQNGPVRVIVTTGPGSSNDATARAMSSALSQALGQPIFIENQPAAGGVSGTRTVVQAPPDGRTIGIVSNSHSSNPLVYKDLPFDSFKDITPITILGTTPLLIVVNPKKLPVNNLAEMTAMLKAKSRGFNYGSSGNGTGLHLAAEMYLDQANVASTHVPYKGAGPMVADLIGGQIDWGCFALAPVLGLVKAGTLRVVAVMSSKRMSEISESQTSVEQGMPNLIFESWNAAIAPAKLPPAVLKKLHDAFVAVSNNAEVREAIQKTGLILTPMSPADTAAFMRAEYEKFLALSKKVNLQIG